MYIKLYNSEYNIADISIDGVFPTMDEYGNVGDALLLSTSIDKQTAEKVNWNQDDSILQYMILPNIWKKR